MRWRREEAVAVGAAQRGGVADDAVVDVHIASTNLVAADAAQVSSDRPTDLPFPASSNCVPDPIPPVDPLAVAVD